MKDKVQGYWRYAVFCEYRTIPDSELNELDKFLRTKSLPGGCTSLTMADGFVAALVVGAGYIPFDKKLGATIVWGQTHKTMKGGATKRELRMAEIIRNHICNVCYHMETERESYMPILNCHAAEAPDYVEWCRGFMKAINLAPRALATFSTSEGARNLIAPFIYFGTESGWSKKMEDKYDSSELGDKFSCELPNLVISIADHFYPSLYLDTLRDFLSKISPHWIMPTCVGDGKR